MADEPTLDELYDRYVAGKVMRRDMFRALIDAVKAIEARMDVPTFPQIQSVPQQIYQDGGFADNPGGQRVNSNLGELVPPGFTALPPRTLSPPKRKGWPKGVKRGPRKPKTEPPTGTDT